MTKTEKNEGVKARMVEDLAAQYRKHWVEHQKCGSADTRMIREAKS